MATLQYGNLLNRVATTVTSGGTTTLINTSPMIQVFTGTSNHTVVFPNATTFSQPGASFQFYNFSTGNIQVNYQDSSSFQTIPSNATLIVNLISNGTANGTFTSLSNSTFPSLNAPTVQKFLSGSGTYTTPTSPSPLYIKVTMVGGGGGGGGVDGVGSGGAGVTGGNTTFGSAFLVANGGVGGDFAQEGGVGGTASISGGALGMALSGGQGGGATGDNTSPRNYSGGNGGNNPLGGGGSGGYVASGFAAASNTGAGGGGGGSQFTTGHGITASGGGAGGYVSAIVNSPAASYSYAVGSAGTGYVGSTFSGGAGGDGLIIIEEHYQ